MSLSLTLNTALTGLNVNQQSLAVLSQNIANANTAGYSRQVINQQSVSLDGKGAGVRVQDITRRVDQYLNNAIQSQNSSLGQASVKNDYAGRIQILLGQPGSNNSLDGYVNQFFNNIRSLAQTPENNTLQRTTVNSAVSLATQIQSLATSLQGLQFQADQDIGTSVTEVNNYLRDLHALNLEIVNARALGRGTSDLDDKRDDLIRNIAQYMDISTYVRDTGAINVVTGSGISLLDDNLYQLSYTPVVSASAFANDSSLSALRVQQVNTEGQPFGQPVDLVTGGRVGEAVSLLGSGKFQGLLDMRDRDIPNILSEMDMLAATMRDQVNAIHNQGSGFPGANSLTGTRLVNGGDYSEWSGEVRIAVLDGAGQPLPSPYPDEPAGVMPYTIDLAGLHTQTGTGNPTIQDIINEINQYYAAPQPKVQVGNLNNIRMVSDSTLIPGPAQQFLFDFDLNNISKTAANFYVTDVQILDNLGVSTGVVTSTVPVIALDNGFPNPTYTTSAGSTVVTISTAGASNNLTEGQVVYLSDPGIAINGIPSTELTGYFTIKNVTATSFEIEVTTPAAPGAAVSVAGQTANPPYVQALAGDNTRAYSSGFFTADLSGNTASPFYTINVSVGVDDGSGNVETAIITYRINNNENGLFNKRLSVVTASGQADIVPPSSSQPLLTAILVDENGVELPKSGSIYTTQQNGYLKLVAGSSSSTVVVDSLDSAQLGKPNDLPAQPGTNRGFSYYFELNNFFKSNAPTQTGDTVKSSAFKLQVEQRIQRNPGLLSLGSLIQVPQPADPDATPRYTYHRNAGDNSVIQRLSDLGLGSHFFATAGGLNQTTQTFSAYAGQIVGAASTNAATYKTDASNAEILLTGFTQRAAAISGVNLDTELANTVIYQNAYSASARVISVTSELFDTLLGTFR